MLSFPTRRRLSAHVTTRPFIISRAEAEAEVPRRRRHRLLRDPVPGTTPASHTHPYVSVGLPDALTPLSGRLKPQYSWGLEDGLASAELSCLKSSVYFWSLLTEQSRAGRADVDTLFSSMPGQQVWPR